MREIATLLGILLRLFNAASLRYGDFILLEKKKNLVETMISILKFNSKIF